MLAFALPLLLSCQPPARGRAGAPAPAKLRDPALAPIAAARAAPLARARPLATTYASFVECAWEQPLGTCCGLFPNHAADPACLRYFAAGSGICYDPEWVPFGSPDYYECYAYCQTPAGASQLNCSYAPAVALDACLYNASANASVAWGECCPAFRGLWESAESASDGAALCQYAAAECAAAPYAAAACVGVACAAPTADPDACSAGAFLQQCIAGTASAQQASCCHDWAAAPNHPDLCAARVLNCAEGDAFADSEFCTRTCELMVRDGRAAELPAACGQLLWALCQGTGQSYGYCCALFAPYGLTQGQQEECDAVVRYCAEDPNVDWRDAACRDYCNREQPPEWCLPFELGVQVDVTANEQDRGVACGLAAALYDSGDPRFRAVWEGLCLDDASRCYGNDTSIAFAPYCYGFCEGTWRAGLPQAQCYTWAPRESEFVTECPGVNPNYATEDVAACCAAHPGLALCERFRAVCADGVTTTDLFAEFVQEFDCAWYCNAGGTPQDPCPAAVEVQYQVCLSHYAAQAEDEDDRDRAFLKVSEGKMSCCLDFPTAASGKCPELLEICRSVRNGVAIVDDYGDPVTGEVLGLVRTTCDDACASGKTSASWCAVERSPAATDASGAPAEPAASAGLSAGAIGGIAFGGIVVVGAIAAVVIYLVLRSKDSTGGEREAVL
jgi:hypothetical protein